MQPAVSSIPRSAPLTTAPIAITGLDATNNTVAQDTRAVQIYNNTLYVSVDTKGGSNAARSYIGTLGTAGTPPTTTVGPPVMLNNFGTTAQNGKVTIPSGANSNGNGPNAGLQINLSPNNYFFANASTLYVADSGNSKQTSANSSLGDGGLQKWINTNSDGSGTWNLAYTLYKGLNLVSNKSAAGSTGLYGLTATVSNGMVQLYTTDYTINDLDPTHLFGITDTLSFTTATQAANESFTTLASAPADSNFKGVSFAPTVVTQITPTITWPAPAAVTFGSALSATQMDATASVPGTFSYNPAAGTVLQAGAGQTLSVTFTPTDTTNYATASASTTITVNPAATTPANLVVTKLLTRSNGNVVVPGHDLQRRRHRCHERRAHRRQSRRRYSHPVTAEHRDNRCRYLCIGNRHRTRFGRSLRRSQLRDHQRHFLHGVDLRCRLSRDPLP